jgi:hypothetical protein
MSNQDKQNVFKKYNSTYLTVTVKCRTAIKVLFTLIKKKTPKIPHSHVKLVSLSCSFTSISFLINITGIHFWDSNRLIHMRCWITLTFSITYDKAKKNNMCVYGHPTHPIFQPPTLTFFIGNYSTLIFANDPINFYTEFG